MRVFIILFFLTLVVFTSNSFAAPQVRSDIKPISLDSGKIDGLAWPHNVSPYNYSLYGGFSGGNFFENDHTIAGSVYGFRFAMDQDLEHSWDYNAEINGSDNLIGLHLGRRTFIDSTTELAPYYKFAVGTHLKGSDGLANFVEIKRWQARASFGMANIFSTQQHLYTEGGVAMAVVGFEYFLVVGLNFNL